MSTHLSRPGPRSLAVLILGYVGVALSACSDSGLQPSLEGVWVGQVYGEVHFVFDLSQRGSAIGGTVTMYSHYILDVSGSRTLDAAQLRLTPRDVTCCSVITYDATLSADGESLTGRLNGQAPNNFSNTVLTVTRLR